jgi:MFS family permease
MNRAAATERVPGKAWLTLAILLLMYVVSFIDRNILALMVEPIKTDLAINDFQISLLQGLSFAFFFVLFGLPMGWLVDRSSRRKIIWLGMTFWSISAAAAGLARSFGQLAVARFGVGAGEASLSPSAYSMLSDLFPRNRLSLAINIFAAGSSIGSAFAYALGAVAVSYAVSGGTHNVPLLGEVRSWQFVFLITGLPGIFIAPLIFLTPEPRRRHRNVDRPNLRMLRSYLSKRRAYLSFTFLSVGMCTLLAYGTAAWFPTYLLRTHGLAIRDVGILVGSIGATTGIAGFVFSGWMSDRLLARGRGDAHMRPILVGAIVMTVMAVIGFGLTHNLVISLFAYATIHFVLPFSQAMTAHVQLTTPNEFRGQVSALYLFVHNLIGQALGPSVIAAFTQFVFLDPGKVGLSIAFTFAIFGTLAIVLLLIDLPLAREAIRQADEYLLSEKNPT